MLNLKFTIKLLFTPPPEKNYYIYTWSINVTIDLVQRQMESLIVIHIHLSKKLIEGYLFDQLYCSINVTIDLVQ